MRYKVTIYLDNRSGTKWTLEDCFRPMWTDSMLIVDSHGRTYHFPMGHVLSWHYEEQK